MHKTAKHQEFVTFTYFIVTEQYSKLYLLKPDWVRYYSLQLYMWVCLHTVIDVGIFWVVAMNIYEEH